MAKKEIKKSVRRKAHKEIKKYVKKVKEVKKVEPVLEPEPVEVPPPSEVSYVERVVSGPVVSPEVKLPVYDHVQITRILEVGHNKTHFKCTGVDKNGNKLELHVPKSAF